jgi:hypothetical protein
VGQREQANTRGLRQCGCSGGRGVKRLVRPLALLLGEGSLVHEDVGVLRDLEDACGRGGVAGEDDRPPGPCRAEHLLGSHDPAFGQLEGLAGL